MAHKEVLLFWKQSPYQRIAFFTEKDGSYSLTLNDFWQFNSGVEHIYHECLFTLPSLFPKKLENILVLGGGDGLGARELLKYPSVKQIDLVDLDPEIIKFAKENVIMTSINKRSFHNHKVKINVTDAKKWLGEYPKKKYDLIIVDFPDPTCDELWTLYTEKLYRQMSKRMHKDSVIAIQSSTYNTRTFDLIFSRLDKVFPYILGYHTGASSVFCGFFLCSFKPIKQERLIPAETKWITPKLINQLLCVPVIHPNGKAKDTKFNLEKKVSQIKKKVVKNPSTLGNYGDNPASPEEFFVTQEALKIPVEQPSPLKNPIVLGGIAAVVATPLLIKVIFK